VSHGFFEEVIRMRKQWIYRFSSLAAGLVVALSSFVGCEAQGPAERAGQNIDKGIQNAKDAISPPGPAEKAGREVDKALKP
jgi:hypothetical protein